MIYGEGGTEEKRVVRDTKNQFHIILTLQMTLQSSFRLKALNMYSVILFHSMRKFL
jgi:hypothetical protein